MSWIGEARIRFGSWNTGREDHGNAVIKGLSDMCTDLYIMNSDEETVRLDKKTDLKLVQRQALWAGIAPGMRVADLGFGSGKTTSCLHRLVQPGGECVGVDIMEERIEYANAHYSTDRIEYVCGDIRKPLDHLGQFDFIWLRFILEYYKEQGFDIIKNITHILKPGGTICLIDMDNNCLNHFEPSPRLYGTIKGIIKILEDHSDFDPYAGRKLYRYLYELDYINLKVDLFPHNIIYGKLSEKDDFNWMKKIEVAGKNSGYPFKEYENGYQGFYEEFRNFLYDPKRFTYNLAIGVKGTKPSH